MRPLVRSLAIAASLLFTGAAIAEAVSSIVVLRPTLHDWDKHETAMKEMALRWESGQAEDAGVLPPRKSG